ncbi:MAG TPA: hypothetical protein DDX91_09635, partial [Ruminococcaceae bacterium]|nr:hypothetical protein [Oscillospiraceae bacterium]
MSRAKIRWGTIVFRIIYALFTLTLIGIVCYTLWHLWHYLEAFERYRPETPIKAAAEQMTNDKMLFFDKLVFNPNEFEKRSFAEDYYKELTSGTITYSRNG